MREGESSRRDRVRHFWAMTCQRRPTNEGLVHIEDGEDDMCLPSQCSRHLYLRHNQGPHILLSRLQPSLRSFSTCRCIWAHNCLSESSILEVLRAWRDDCLFRVCIAEISVCRCAGWRPRWLARATVVRTFLFAIYRERTILSLRPMMLVVVVVRLEILVTSS
jgi:hypothetical protein